MKSIAAQKGLALLVLVIAVVLASLALFFGGVSPQTLKQDRDISTRIALQQARQALISYAVNFPEITGVKGPGRLPCPDRDNDGVSDTGLVPSCNAAIGSDGAMGRLPYKTLNVGELYDGSGERLWYAVSKTYSNFGNKVVNTSKAGTITVRTQSGAIEFDGTGPDAAIAVIIAPGESLRRSDGYVQDRSVNSADLNDPMNYLDIASGEDNANFIQGGTNGFIRGPVRDANGAVINNDIIAVVSYRDIMEAVKQRVSGELKTVLQQYYSQCGKYPEALDFDATRSDGNYRSDDETIGHLPADEAKPHDWGDSCANGVQLPAWLAEEDWHKEILYAYSETTPCVPADCLTVITDSGTYNDIELMLMFAGRDLNGSHDTDDINEYFENENSDGDRVFDATEVEDDIRIVQP